MKKSIFIIVLAIFGAIAVFCKEYILIVHKSDDTSDQYELNDVDSLTFIEKNPANLFNGQEFVDLGLPSGTLWATCNVGATNPEDYGNYYAWGEIKPKSDYYWNNYKHGTALDTLTKYCDNSDYGKDEFIDNKVTLDPEDDAATVSWGSPWRMPTKSNFEELKKNCILTWKKKNGIFGYELQSKTNGNIIFLPAAGYRGGKSLLRADSEGRYWSSSLSSGTPDEAYNIHFISGAFSYSNFQRRYGFSIRAVYCKSELQKVPVVTTDMISDITDTLASCGGNVTSEGGLSVTERGICWSTNENPTILDSKTESGSGYGNFTCFLIGLTPNTTYYVRAYAINQFGISYGSQRIFTTDSLIVVESGKENGHEYVDLGLPSGTLWATCNIGANKPEEYGNYYAWGETTTKTTYNWNTYIYGNYNRSASPNYGMIKYNKTDNKTTLDLSDDAARVNWGGNWRIPTFVEQMELWNNCTWTWTTKNGKNGYEVKGKNGNSIFLPVAGYHSDYDSGNIYAGLWGCYWSSSLNSDRPFSGYGFTVTSVGRFNGTNGRSEGLSVRAVASCKPKVETGDISEITKNSATLHGEILTEGTSEITEKGFVYSAIENPEISKEGIIKVEISGEEFVATRTSLTPNTTYYVRAYAINQFGISYGSQRIFTTDSLIVVESGKENGHAYIDLGLPSGTLWATCNMGATNPEDYGDYFAWGETTNRINFDSYNYDYNYNDDGDYIKYNNSDHKTTLDLADDAARVNWGGEWRMPTLDEYKELLSNCFWTWTIQNGINGYKVEGTNKNSIFLPAAGEYYSELNDFAGIYGSYWSSSLDSEHTHDAFLLMFHRNSCETTMEMRWLGYPVRAVKSCKPEVEAGDVPEITITGETHICLGEATILTAPDGVSWAWSNGETSNSIVVNPSVNTTYSVITTLATGCTMESSVAVIVNQPPAITLKANNQTICLGEQVTITATGAATWLWNNGKNSAEIIESPTETTTYTVIGTDVNGCEATTDITITVKNPENGVISGKTSVCEGESVTLTAPVGSNYKWSNNSTQSTITVPITADETTFFVTLDGTNGCRYTTANHVVKRHLKPSGTITGNKTICRGSSTTLKAPDGVSWIWNNNATTQEIEVSPFNTVTYDVIVTGEGGCTSAFNTKVIVNQPPTLSLKANNQTICLGEQVTITATGAATWLWNNGKNSAEIIETPTETTTYTVIGTDVNGCEATTDITITVKQPKNDHEYVDLGLPSGTLWATCNVGATTPEEYGNYYAWGETQTKSTYDWSTYKYGNYNSSSSPNYGMTKYNKTDNKTTLELADDAAHANWSGNWRMPTYEEQEELIKNCTLTWTTKNGINGYEVKSKTNGNTIFLPAAGSRYNSNLSSTGEFGGYWGSSLDSSYPDVAYFLNFYSGLRGWGSNYRCYGRSVRAVCSSR